MIIGGAGNPTNVCIDTDTNILASGAINSGGVLWVSNGAVLTIGGSFTPNSGSVVYLTEGARINVIGGYNCLGGEIHVYDSSISSGEGVQLNTGTGGSIETNGSDGSVFTFIQTSGDLQNSGSCSFNINVCPTFIDFDGVDDYLDATPFISNWDKGTIMAWVKIEPSTSGDLPSIYSIAGQETMRLYITINRIPTFSVLSQNQVTSGDNYPSAIPLQPTDSNIKIVNNLWYHIAGVFDMSTQTLKLYLNGELMNTITDPYLNSELLTKNFDGTPHEYLLHEFTVGRYPTNVNPAGFDYFEGSIDEVRVFDSALTDNQIQQMVYQEIENNGGFVKGKILPKDIQDLNTLQKVSWNNLKGYYPMTNMVGCETTDESSNNNQLTIHNITTVQEQTAPMPYISNTNGDWSSNATWLHGNLWDVASESTNKDWSIVDIKHDVTTSNSHTNLGLIIENNKSLTVNGDNKIENTWYLELNGTLDLKNDSQLIQTINSDLVTSATGKILRRQEGTSSAYRYNYWSSPVGATSVTTLSDNNAATNNNNNNTTFSLNMLNDEMGMDILFTSAYQEVGKISTYWLYTYKNGLTYWDWAFLPPNSPLNAGVGYTQKGTGNAGLSQQYIFEGKPNNGTILVNVSDIGGSGSVPTVSKTEYLLGNPYPSALDIHKFIDDNVGVIDGSLQLWQQWGGNTHVLREYEGGYAQVNKLGSIIAYQFVGIDGANNGSLDGTLIPTRYLPIGQGFIIEIAADGNVEFNNSQRVFIKEADADNTYNNGSVFFKSGSTKSKGATLKESNENLMQKIRLEFDCVVGPNVKRELLLGFSNNTTDDFDYGYDTENVTINNNDLNLNLNGKDMNIQAYSKITNDKIIPLNFKSSDTNSFEIKISETENIDETQDIFIKDKLVGEYFDLTQGTAYSFTSDQGKFNERFEIVFQSEQKSLDVEEAKHGEGFIYYSNKTNTLFAKKMNISVSRLALINMIGQTVLELKDVSQTVLSNGIKLSNIATGTYIACLRTKDNQVLTKKIIVN